MATVKELEKRLAAVERELDELRRFVVTAAEAISEAWEGPQAILERLQQRVADADRDELCRKMGIVGEPPGIEKLREMMLAAGIKPEDNVGSREIRAMRGQ
jgi:hypothetical protein